jgi:hypothetical protein
MIFTIFMIGVAFMIIFLYLGFTQYSFPMAYLGFFVMLILGMFVMSEGIDFENGMRETSIGSHHFVTVYETHTVQDDIIVSIIGNTFFYFPLAGILLTTFFALRRFQ